MGGGWVVGDRSEKIVGRLSDLSHSVHVRPLIAVVCGVRGSCIHHSFNISVLFIYAVKYMFIRFCRFWGCWVSRPPTRNKVCAHH